MTDQNFQQALAMLMALPLEQRNRLVAELSQASTGPDARWRDTTQGAFDGPAAAAPDDPIAIIEARFAGAPACPHCGSTSIRKWGSANALRRYMCKPCKVTFNALTGTPLAQLHKRELWGKHSAVLVDGLSLRKVSARIGVTLQTAFRWRHRFLEAAQHAKANSVSGVVEADETYFLRSEKGSRTLTRKPRSRGGKAKKRGLSDEQIPVLIVRDRNKATTDKVLADRSERSITEVLGPIMAKDCILVSDGAPSYRAFSNKAEILHVAVIASAGERTWGIYHIQNANAYISGLKTWMVRFRGVATKYLETYLGWRRLIDRESCNLTAKRQFIAALG